MILVILVLLLNKVLHELIAVGKDKIYIHFVWVNWFRAINLNKGRKYSHKTSECSKEHMCHPSRQTQQVGQPEN